MKSINMPVDLIQVTVGKANPPDAVKNQRIQTASEQQRKETETQRKIAEDTRKEAEKSRAAADNAYRESMQLSTAQFLELERIKMQGEACSKGKSSCTFIVGSASSAVPVFDVKGK